MSKVSRYYKKLCCTSSDYQKFLLVERMNDEEAKEVLTKYVQNKINGQEAKELLYRLSK